MVLIEAVLLFTHSRKDFLQRNGYFFFLKLATPAYFSEWYEQTVIEDPLNILPIQGW